MILVGESQFKTGLVKKNNTTMATNIETEDQTSLHNISNQISAFGG